MPGIKVAPDEGYDETQERRHIPADPDAPFAGLAFKIINDKYGNLTFVRVYRGTLKQGDMIQNTTKDGRERIGRMFQMHADKREEIKEVFAGDIAAFVGLKDTGTGDTLASTDDPVVLERMAFPVPVIDISVEPQHQGGCREDDARPAEAGRRGPLAARCAPTRRPARPSCPAWASCTWRSSSTGCAANTAWTANIGAPQVAYRETITKPHTEIYTHKKQTGGSGQYAEVKIVFEPKERNDGHRVRQRRGRRRGAARIRPGGREGHQDAGRYRRAGRLPDRGLQVHAGGRQVPRRRLLARWPSRSPPRPASAKA